MRSSLCSAVIGASMMLLASAAPATTATVNYTDLWWNPAESGWGVNMTQQATTLYMTFYVYDRDATPMWISALLRKTGESPNGQPIFTGDTYLSTGPWFGGPFTTPPFQIARAGSITFTPNDAVSGTLTYDVNGTRVTKSIQRETLVDDDLSGSYLTTWQLSVTCPPAASETQELIGGHATITHSGTSFQLQEVDDLGETCTWAGGWTQQGQLARVDGNFSCVDGTSGTFTMSEIASSPIGISGRVSANGRVNLPPLTACSATGSFSALRR
ncbi:MAG: hypothetical protein ACM3JC_00520 [Rudaea sp.]